MPDQSPIEALIERVSQLTSDEFTALANAWNARAAARAAARDALGDPWDALGDAAPAAWASGAAWDAAWATGAAWAAARDAARAAARDAARSARIATWAAGIAVGDAAIAARDAALALALRGELAPEYYDVLTGPWARVIGRVHPDDPDRRGSDA
jgi:hypothetical protein